MTEAKMTDFYLSYFSTLKTDPLLIAIEGDFLNEVVRLTAVWNPQAKAGQSGLVDRAHGSGGMGSIHGPSKWIFWGTSWILSIATCGQYYNRATSVATIVNPIS